MVPAGKSGSPEEREEPTKSFVSEDQIAQRWSCSRSTVRRILDAAQTPVFCFSGQTNGIKRYRLADVRRIEDSTRTDKHS